MTFVEATRTQGKEDFLGSLTKALHYYGGVPAAIVTDNLRTAVKKVISMNLSSLIPFRILLPTIALQYFLLVPIIPRTRLWLRIRYVLFIPAFLLHCVKITSLVWKN